MEKNETKSQPLTSTEEPQDIISRAKANSKLILGLSIFILAVVAGILIWFFVSQNRDRKSEELCAPADAAAMLLPAYAIQDGDAATVALNDSIINLYKPAAEYNTRAGNRAKVEIGMRLYRVGKYEEALKYLDDADVKDNIVAAGVLTLKGDCYVNLNKLPEAIEAYSKAIKKADENPTIVPLILFKEANIYREQKNYEAEYEALEELVNKYPEFANNYPQVDIQKYYERAKAAAGK